MRTSCNGCRVLRKGCNENCEIRPCIEWIRSPESQANATLFLAKFYGRAGLLNLINAGAYHQRPGIFRSLLYEACGRIVNPTYGSVGLLSSGNWAQCQAAVDAVLAGSPIVGNNELSPYLINPNTHVTTCDIRNVSNDASVARPTRNRVKRSRSAKVQVAEWGQVNEFGQSSMSEEGGERSMQSVETVEASKEKKLGNGNGDEEEEEEVGLDLTLGFGIGKMKGKGKA